MRKLGLTVVMLACFFGSAIGCCKRVPARIENGFAMSPESEGLRVYIAVPERGEIQVRGAQPAIHVVFENTSQEPLALIDEWNSFGYYNLTFEYTMSDGIRRTMKKDGYVAWLRNDITITTLRPGEVLTRDIYFDPTKWTGLPTITQDTPVTIEAIFTQDGRSGLFREEGGEEGRAQDGSKVSFWKGILRSAPVRGMLKVGR